MGVRVSVESAIISDGKFEPINPRTAKKFFELARALVTYAHDQGHITENIAAGLAFSTKGAEAPRKRTYSPSQIEKLLHGPAYTLTKPPRWRLFLPLIGKIPVRLLVTRKRSKRPFARIVVQVFQNHAHSTLTDFRGVGSSLSHGLIFSRVEASTKPGVIHHDSQTSQTKDRQF